MKTLRQYQTNAKNKLRESVRAGNKRIVFYAPTGAGKSIQAVDLIASLLGRGKRVAFIANRIGLVRQFSEHLQSAGIPHGIIQGDNTYAIHSNCVVCSINTLASRGLPPVDYAIIDEVHCVPGSNAYLKLIFAMNNIHWIGLTATPFSKGMAKVHHELRGEPLFQDIVVAATIRELIDQGSLVDCEIYAPRDPDLTGVRSARNAFGELDYNDKDLGAAVDKPELVGDIVSHWLRLAKGKKTVIFATNVTHSKHIVEQFKAEWVNAEHIDGYMTDEEKLPILERFKTGETQIISNVAMLKEGWDVPSCECMILAKPTKSLIAWIQMCGRILRPFAEKTHGLIIDHSGSVHRLGYPTDDLPLELCDGTKKDAANKKPSDKPKPKERKCPKCHFIKKSHKCPKCGFMPEQKSTVEVEDGDLGKVLKVGKPEKQAWFSQLLCYAKSKGYSPRWAANYYKDKFGVWPRGLHEGHAQPDIAVIGWITHKQIEWREAQKKKSATKSDGIGKLAELKARLSA